MDKLEELKSALAKVKPEEVHCSDDPVDEVLIDVSDINLNTMGSADYSVDITSGLYGNTVLGSSYNYANVTINSGATGSFAVSNGGSGYSWANNITTSSNPSLNVSGDAEFEGDIKWKGRSLGTLLESIEDRLAILAEQDPAKLEKFAALKKAYDHYKLLEKLIGED